MPESRYLAEVFAKARQIYSDNWTGNPYDDAGSIDAAQAVIDAAHSGELESDGFHWCSLCMFDAPYVVCQQPYEHATCLICDSVVFPDSLFPI